MIKARKSAWNRAFASAKAHALVCLTAAMIPAAEVAPPGSTLSFLAASDDDTGLRRIMMDWAALELERQGGKYGDHGWWPWGLTLIDFDNDGDIDLIPTHHGKPGGKLLRNQLKESGKLLFTDVTQAVFGDSLVPRAENVPKVWDFDGDGWLDVAGLTGGGPTASFFNEAGKRLVAIPGFTFSPMRHAKEIRDQNGDGFPDVCHATSNISATEGYTWYLYDSAKRSFTSNKLAPPETPRAKLPGFEGRLTELKQKKNNRFLGLEFRQGCDLNGDGLGDLVAAFAGGYDADWLGLYYLSDKDGAWTDKTSDLGLPEAGTPIAVQDMTGDGADDVLIAGGDTAGLHVNDGSGHFTRKDGDLTVFAKQRDPYTLRALFHDFDADGDLDVVMSAPRAGREAIFENLGAGEYRTVLTCKGWDSHPIAICDINLDGLLDVCIGGPGDSITLYLNTTMVPGNQAIISPRMVSPNPFAIGARVEIFTAGDLENMEAQPLRTEYAHPDSTPIYVGLGKATTFDVRITFPEFVNNPAKKVELKELGTDRHWRITPDGPSSPP